MVQACLELDESAADIIGTLVESAFRIVTDKTSAKVKQLLFDLLHPLLNESEHIAPRVFDILLTRIIEPAKSNNKEACSLAVMLLKRGNEHFESLVQHHLNTIVLSTAKNKKQGSSSNSTGLNLTLNATSAAPTSKKDDESDDDDAKTNSESDDDEDAVVPPVAAAASSSSSSSSSSSQFVCDKLCLVIYELNAIRPTLLELLMPQLEWKLKSSEAKERREYTRLLSKMFSEQADAQLVHQLPALWEAYLERFADVSDDVRKICVQYVGDFLVQFSKPQQQQQQLQQAASADASSASSLSSNAALLEQIVEQVRNRALDADETIRLDVVQEILKAVRADTATTPAAAHTELLAILKGRTLDVKIKVRKAALQGLAALYRKVHAKCMAAYSSGLVTLLIIQLIGFLFVYCCCLPRDEVPRRRRSVRRRCTPSTGYRRRSCASTFRRASRTSCSSSASSTRALCPTRWRRATKWRSSTTLRTRSTTTPRSLSSRSCAAACTSVSSCARSSTGSTAAAAAAAAAAATMPRPRPSTKRTCRA